MTEQHPPYRAFSDLPIQTAHTGTIPVASPLQQHYADGSTSTDILLLLPILHSPESSDAPAVCLHLVHLADGNLGLCNGKTEQCCPCCGFAMCEEHTSKHAVALPDETGTWQEENNTLLCETCAGLSVEQMYAIHAFRLSINQLQAREESGL